MSDDQSNEHLMEGIAYREAGHVLMAYLLLKAGIADSSFAMPIHPRDRKYLVPEFSVVTVDGELSKLARPTFSLRSLVTVPLFIFAGFAAQRIQEGLASEAHSGDTEAEGRARGMIASYIDEYGGRTSGPESRLVEAFSDSYEVAEQGVRKHWRAVQALAQSLQEDRILSRDTAFEVIELHLPEETQKAVKTIASTQSPDKNA